MKNIFSKLVWFSVAILVCSSLVYAQTQIGGASLNGVVTDPSNAVVAFGGQRGPNNALLVDGADSNNLFYGQATGRTGFRPYAFSQDAVQEFQVNANAFPAEVGRASGGVINVITRSGSNDFHGTAFEFYRDRG